MNKKLLYISDYFYEEINGGGEANDKELLDILSNKYSITKIKSQNINLEIINNFKDCLIISNFILLNPKLIEYITYNCKYIIYEHDHKYLKTRNPALYEDFIAPSDHIINEEFYKNAKAVFCQSKLHKNILDKNLKFVNSISLSGNLWSLSILDLIKQYSKNLKQDSYAIMNSDIDHKNTLFSINFCKIKNYQYKLINKAPHEKFLEEISLHKGLAFFPKTPETLSRIAVEARMLNMSVITNKNLGASYEDWFSLKGLDLINIIKNKRFEICLKIEEYL